VRTSSFPGDAVMKKKAFVMMTLFCFAASDACFAWNAKTHETIAKIAELNVKPATLKKIKAILKDETMVSVSTWADGDIRKTQKETDHWHTVKISVNNAALNTHVAAVPSDFTSFYPESNDNVIFQLKRLIQELKNPNTPAETKYIDLKFLIHFTGDLHMPMHCATNEGKNIIDTEANRAKEKPQTLHNVWDAMLPVKDVDETAETLSREITGAQKKKWSVNNPDAWVFESYRISRETIFKDIPYKSKYVTLPKDYKKTMRPIAKERVEQAGIRLAMLLDYIFAK
jgi:hypothetical protein